MAHQAEAPAAAVDSGIALAILQDCVLYINQIETLYYTIEKAQGSHVSMILSGYARVCIINYRLYALR